jgi:hypothetical protein
MGDGVELVRGELYVVTGTGPGQGVDNSAWFKDIEGKVWQYDNARGIKEKHGKYVVIDPNGNLLGAHPIVSIAELPRIRPQ